MNLIFNAFRNFYYQFGIVLPDKGSFMPGRDCNARKIYSNSKECKACRKAIKKTDPGVPVPCDVLVIPESSPDENSGSFKIDITGL